jgi:NitT/TauT family transport system substrate-binding protein
MGATAVRHTVALLASAAMLTGMAGCGLLPGSQQPATPQLERSTLRIGVQPMVDVAPLYLAREQKLFEAAGLRVDLVQQANDDSALTQLGTGTLDMAFATYVSMFKGGSTSTLQLQGEAYQAASNTMALVTKPDSAKYKNFSDFANSPPTIAVNSLNDLGMMTTKSVLQLVGVDPTTIRFKAVPYADMATALKNNQVDAAWMIEPFITQAQKDFGAQIITDAARGATSAFPISGYVASRQFASNNPKTLAAFRKVLAQAQQLAANPLTVRTVLPLYANVDTGTAELISIGTYPASLNAVRLQRVADLWTLQQLGVRLDVAQWLPPAAAS